MGSQEQKRVDESHREPVLDRAVGIDGRLREPGLAAIATNQQRLRGLTEHLHRRLSALRRSQFHCHGVNIGYHPMKVN